MNVALPLFEAPVLVQTGENGIAEYFYFPESKQFISETDTRPPYNCDSYEIIDDSTFFVTRNEFHHNFHIQFMKKSAGAYSEIDFGAIFQNDDCDLGNFNGRIPWFDPNGNEGVITYAILSRLFRLSFLDDTIQLRFWVYDRDLNMSNVAHTPDFVLSDIQSD